MKSEPLPDGTTKYTYDSEGEYNIKGLELYRTHGRHQIKYEGWLNGELVRIY